MARYDVKLKAVGEQPLPDLLKDFGAWLKDQPHPSLGYFDSLRSAAIPREWSPEAASRLRRDGFAFCHLPDGSLLALLSPPSAKGASAPPAVVLLGSEGDAKTVASSLEEFLLALGNGETGVRDLDDEDADGSAAGRKALKAWLKKKAVRAPKAKPFDFGVYLGGSSASPTPALAIKPTPAIAALSPLARELAMSIGRRADDPELVKFVQKKLGKKPPASTSEADDTAYVLAPKHGLELLFSHDVSLPSHPPIKNGRTFVPYFSQVWLKDKLPEPLPYGLKLQKIDNGYGKLVSRLDEAEARRVLGEPTAVTKRIGRKTPIWRKPLDAKRGVWFRADFFDGPVIDLSDGKIKK